MCLKVKEKVFKCQGGREAHSRGVVPTLRAKDIYRGGFFGPNKTACLAGWAFSVFSGTKQPLLPVLDKLIDNAGIRGSKTDSLGTWNDKMPKSRVAALWNETMEEMGLL